MTVVLSLFSMTAFATWIRPIYLYLVSLVAVIVFIIGSVTLLNLLVRNYVFGLKTSYYNNPRYACESYLTLKETTSSDFTVRGLPAPSGTTITLNDQQRKSLYDKCIEQQKEDQLLQEKYDFANNVSWSFSMLLVSSLVFAFHWRLVRKERGH